jgi:hypothetical protein
VSGVQGVNLVRNGTVFIIKGTAFFISVVGVLSEMIIGK